MATLNTLRTKFGIVLSAVIAFALLAFIFSLKAEMGFSGNDPIVAKINGQDVTYTEYYSEYEQTQRISGITEVDDQQADMLYGATWQSLVAKYLFMPGIESMGVNISEGERLAMIRGEIPTQALFSAFGDPSTGAYDYMALNNFLFMSNGSPDAEAAWAAIMSQARDERVATKYAGLVLAGVNANDLEVAAGLEGANKSFDGRWAVKLYSTVADSEVALSDSEVKSYYEAHKSLYKREPSRTISYVEFDVEPSAADLAALESKANDLAAGFETAADVRMFVRESRSGSVAQNYVSAVSMSASEAEAVSAGKMYGPVVDGDRWKMSRAESNVYASDTLSLRHIVLSYASQDLADSLLVALRKADATDFVAAARTHSVYQETAQSGGDVGEIPFSEFVDEFAEALAPARKGDIVKIESGDMIQLVQVYEAGPRVKHYRVATIDVPIVPSTETRTVAHNKAGLFAVDAKGGVDAFKAAASETEVSSHSVDVVSSIRTIAAIPGSSEVVRWAHKAKIGDVSEIFKVNNGYVVAMLTAVNGDEYLSLKDVEAPIRQEMLRKKKFELLKAGISGSTFESQMESLEIEGRDFSDVNLNSYYIAGAGVEPRLIGAIASSSEGAVAAPVQGLTGLFLYVVDDVKVSDEPQTAEAEKLRLEMTTQQMTQQMLFSAVEAIGDIEDLRGSVL